jgi:ABC-2 type transport system permease protein
MRDWIRLVASLARATVGNLDALVLFAAAIAFYSFFYPWPYGNQLVENVPVVVADLDASATSRRVVQALRGTPAVRIVGVTRDQSDGVALLKTEGASVMLVVPAHFERDLLAGRRTVLAAIGTGAYPVQAKVGMAGVLGPLIEEATRASARQLLAAGVPLSALARASLQGPAIVVQPMFNLVPGYASYVVPIVGIVILQSILLMAITLAMGGWLASDVRPQHLERALSSRSGLTALAATFSLVALFWLLYLQGLAFWVHDFPTLQNVTGMLVVGVPLSLAIGSLGLALSLALGSDAYAMQVVVVTSIPAVFLSGAIFPWSNMPAWTRGIADLFPSTPGIQGLLAASQMGGPTSAVLGHALHLLLLAAGYFGLAVWLSRPSRT